MTIVASETPSIKYNVPFGEENYVYLKLYLDMEYADKFILRAMLSQQEANEFVERELCCPYCGYMVGIAFSDCTGHLKLKCKKCKRISVLNFAYFCRRRFRRK